MPDPTLTRRDALAAAGVALGAAGLALAALGTAVENLADVLDVDPLPPRPPARPALVTGPVWPAAVAQYRGAAPISTGGAPTATEVTLRPRTQGSSASDLHEVHVVLDERIGRYAWQVETRVDESMLDAYTWKVGGMAAFDTGAPQAWSHWPGGSTSAGAAGRGNAMERLAGQNTTAGPVSAPRNPADARFGVYCTFPEPVAVLPAGVDGITAPVGGKLAWVSNGGHTCHWEIRDVHLEAGRWYRHRREVDVDAGTLRHWIDETSLFELAGLPWPPAGFNRVYWSVMIGGSDPECMPRTPDRTGRLAYRLFRLERI